MNLRNSSPARYFYQFLEKTILKQLANTGIQPNHLTLMGSLMAIGVPLGFFFHPFWGLLFMIFSGILDATDGLLARKKGKATLFGAFLDSTMDRFSDFCFLFGFWILFWISDRIIPASILIFMAMFFSFFISYIKARASAIGMDMDIGLMDRGLRTIYLMIWALLLGLFPTAFQITLWSGLVLYCMLCLYTVFQRLAYVFSVLKKHIPMDT